VRHDSLVCVMTHCDIGADEAFPEVRVTDISIKQDMDFDDFLLKIKVRESAYVWESECV